MPVKYIINYRSTEEMLAFIFHQWAETEKYEIRELAFFNFVVWLFVEKELKEKHNKTPQQYRAMIVDTRADQILCNLEVAWSPDPKDYLYVVVKFYFDPREDFWFYHVFFSE